MDARLQRRVQRYGWDRAAPYYEAYWQAQLEPAQRLLLELADLKAGERVVDVACGTGLVTLPAARAVGPSGEVVGTDLSEAMAAATRAAADTAGLVNVRAERMDAEKLTLGDDEFDVALCALGLMYPPDPVQALAEMRRVVRPGGRVIAAVWGARRNCGWAGVFPVVDARVESDVCPLFFQLGTGDALSIAMTTAGLASPDCRRIRTVLEYDSADDAIGAAFVGGPVALAYDRFDDETRAAADADYLETIAGFATGDGYRIPGEFVVGRADVPA